MENGCAELTVTELDLVAHAFKMSAGYFSELRPKTIANNFAHKPNAAIANNFDF